MADGTLLLKIKIYLILSYDLIKYSLSIGLMHYIAESDDSCTQTRNPSMCTNTHMHPLHACTLPLLGKIPV